ncbi:hypothetical protein ACEPAI_2843 [Sanghuangporus weigelae]
MIPSLIRLNSRVSSIGSRHSVRTRLVAHYARPNSTSQVTTTNFEEELLSNDKNGYNSVHAGSTIKGDGGETYEAVRKLGWGINSTVWVGRNCSENASPKYVALKILNNSATREHDLSSSTGADTNELDMLFRSYDGKEPQHRPKKPTYAEQGLTSPPHPGWMRVAGCLGAFPCGNSQHLVIVSPLYGEHMRDYMRGEPDKRLALPLVKRIARQILQALDYLHSECGIIHSDVKPENMFRDFNLGPEIDDIFEAIRTQEPNAGRDGHSAALWIPHHDRLDYFFVVLADLSHASWRDLIKRSPRSVGSPALKAPELVLAFAYTTKIDIWSLGCTLFELLTGRLLFSFPDSRSPNELAQEPKYHLNLIQNLIREPLFPEASRGTITVEEGFIDSDGWIKSPENGDTLEERIAKDVPSDVIEKDVLTVFLRRCLRLDPSKRASASELLDDPWLAEG